MNIKEKKVLVTGGAGFIGSRLCSFLSHEGFDVLAVDNLFTGKKEFLSNEVKFKELDIRSKELNEVINEFKPDIIAHLAAIHYIPYCNDNPEETFDVNVMGTRNLLEASEGVKILFASSASVYPIQDEPLNEEICGPLDVYGQTKLIGEDLVKYKAQEFIITRFFNAYGPNETNPHVIPEIIQQVMDGKESINLGNLTPKRDYIYVDDICSAIIALIKQGEKGTFNIGTGTEYSVKELVDTFENILGKKIQINQDKTRMRKVEREHLLADITKIKEKVGWKPQFSFEEGLKETLKSL